MNKKSKFFRMLMLTLMFVLFFTLNTHRVACADNTELMIGENTFQFGFDIRYLDYEEDGLIEEDGLMYGIAGSYIYHGNNKLMFETSFSLVFGEIDYDGQTQSGTPLKADTDDWIFEWRGLIGKDYRFKSSSIITPFMGIGYRYWNDDIDASGGYEREIQYWYLPVGVKTISPLNGNWTWGISLEYDLFLGGKVQSHLSDVQPVYNDPENDQDFGDGYGLALSLKFNRNLSNSYGFSIEPYIRYWDIDESDTSTLTSYGIPIAYVVEPDNETIAYGLRLNITF
ncbi:MAG: autotransporter outer membrane beta-barrel domain-containing protein [Desulfobacterales bacterium]